MRDALEDEIPHLRRFAHGLTRDAETAEDLVQDCLARALDKEDRYDPERALRPWLFRMLRNLFLTTRRKKREAQIDWELLEATPTASAPAADALILKQTLDALYSLPTEQREVMTLICVEEMSYKEAAEIIGAPIGTVMSRLARGREALRRQCGETRAPHLRRVK